MEIVFLIFDIVMSSVNSNLISVNKQIDSVFIGINLNTTKNYVMRLNFHLVSKNVIENLQKSGDVV